MPSNNGIDDDAVNRASHAERYALNHYVGYVYETTDLETRSFMCPGID